MNGVQERLRLFIRHEKLTIRAFETKIGLSNGYVKNIHTSIQPDKLEKIAEAFPTLNLGWLLVGKGQMLIAPDTGGSIKDVNNQSTHVVANGESSVAAMNSSVSTAGGQLVDSLKREIELKDQVIEEKERLIKVLMEGRK